MKISNTKVDLNIVQGNFFVEFNRREVKIKQEKSFLFDWTNPNNDTEYLRLFLDSEFYLVFRRRTSITGSHEVKSKRAVDADNKHKVAVSWWKDGIFMVLDGKTQGVDGVENNATDDKNYTIKKTLVEYYLPFAVYVNEPLFLVNTENFSGSIKLELIPLQNMPDGTGTQTKNEEFSYDVRGRFAWTYAVVSIDKYLEEDIAIDAAIELTNHFLSHYAWIDRNIFDLPPSHITQIRKHDFTWYQIGYIDDNTQQIKQEGKVIMFGSDQDFISGEEVITRSDEINSTLKRAVSSKERPPLLEQLFLSARHHLNYGDPRISIVESNTAMESYFIELLSTLQAYLCIEVKEIDSFFHRIQKCSNLLDNALENDRKPKLELVSSSSHGWKTLSGHPALLGWHNNTYVPRCSIVHKGALKITEVEAQKAFNDSRTLYKLLLQKVNEACIT